MKELDIDLKKSNDVKEQKEIEFNLLKESFKQQEKNIQ